MESQDENTLNFFINPEELAKFRQREALENLGTNLVDLHIQQLTSVPSHTPTIPAHPVIGLGCASGWLLVTFAYYLMTRKMRGV